MSSVIAADFLVLGAGMAGASAAAYLAEMGHVVLLEMEAQAGYHSTGRSAAVFSETYGNAIVRRLTQASRDFLFDPPAGFATARLTKPREALLFARPDQRDLLAHYRATPDMRERTIELSATDVVDRIPLFRPDYLGGGILEPGCADLDVDAIHQGFLRSLRARKGQIHFNCGVRQLTRKENGWLAHTYVGAFAAPVVVNAAGAWADEIAVHAGVTPVGLQVKRRTAALIPVPGNLDASRWPIAVDIGDQLYFKPDAGLLMVSPADEHECAPCDAQPEDIDVAIAIDRFEQVTGSEVRQVRRTWAGLRVFAADRSPVVGFDPVAEGFFWLVGQGGYGIQTAPALGRLAAALATEQSIPRDISERGLSEVMLSKSRFDVAAGVATDDRKQTAPVNL